MKNIHLLPTDKSSRLSIKDGILILHRLQWRKGTHHIHITTNDEEIKEGDWFLDDNNQISHSYRLSHVKFANPKKIILTTDQDLIKDGVQSIDDEFLEWFFKNRNYEWVEVEIESKFDRVDGHYHDVWEIIIPKEEPKQSTKDRIMSETSEETKRKVRDYGNSLVTETETLEEAAKKLTNDFPVLEVRFNMSNEEIYGWFLEALQKGVKWQQEQDKNKYSEEEVRNIANWAFGFYRRNDLSDSELEDEFNRILVEQFKKK